MMSHNSKKTIASTVTGVIAGIAYVIYALGDASPSPEDLKSWAVAMLVFIGISIAALIVVQILFHIDAAIRISVKEREAGGKKIDRSLSSLMVEDERDQLIHLKSSRVGHIFTGLGFVVALIGLAMGVEGIFALHILFGSLAVGSIIEGFVSVYFYETGVRNG